MLNRTFVRDVPEVLSYLSDPDREALPFSRIRLGGVTLTQRFCVMKAAQDAGFFSKIAGMPDYAVKDWMARTGSRPLYVYTMGEGDDEQIIGWADDDPADFETLSEFVYCAQQDEN